MACYVVICLHNKDLDEVIAMAKKSSRTTVASHTFSTHHTLVRDALTSTRALYTLLFQYGGEKSVKDIMGSHEVDRQKGRTIR